MLPRPARRTQSSPRRCRAPSPRAAAGSVEPRNGDHGGANGEDWRERTRRLIFEADTPGGKAFDVALLFLISFSVLLLTAESVDRVRAAHAADLRVMEWTVTLLFTVEYVARLATVERPRRYARSFYGVIDLLAVVPVYLSVLIPEAQSLLVLRSLRLLRVFRVFKMAQWLSEASYRIDAVRASTRKIGVFLITVILIDVVVESTMYVIEGPQNGSTTCSPACTGPSSR